jgi:hypothetical protein
VSIASGVTSLVAFNRARSMLPPANDSTERSPGGHSAWIRFAMFTGREFLKVGRLAPAAKPEYGRRRDRRRRCSPLAARHGDATIGRFEEVLPMLLPDVASWPDGAVQPD